MITLKLNSYTADQCKQLSDLLYDTAKQRCDKEYPRQKCELCPGSRICKDLRNAADFAERAAQEKYARG